MIAMTRRKTGRRLVLLSAVSLFLIVTLFAWASWDHVRFWMTFEPLGTNAKGYPEYRHRRTGIVMVRVPGGRFSMGTSPAERERILKELNFRPSSETFFRRCEEDIRKEEPTREVLLSPFLIAKYEITVDVWERLRGIGSRSRRGSPQVAAGGIGFDEALAFCRGVELKLPTEAQWERACRGPVGQSQPASSGLDEIAWHAGNSGGRVHPVGQKKANGFGLYDMLGNVQEWCADTYDPAYWQSPASRVKDPVCRSPAQRDGLRLARGGSFWSESFSCRPSFRGVVKASGYATTLLSRTAFMAPAPFAGLRPTFAPLP